MTRSIKARIQAAWVVFASMLIAAITSRSHASVLHLSYAVPSDTNGHYWFNTYADNGGFVVFVGVTPTQDFHPTSVKAIFGGDGPGSGGTPLLDQVDFHYQVWNSYGAASGDAFSGNIANLLFDQPTNGFQPYGFDNTGRPTWEMLFDVSGLSTVLPANQLSIIAIRIANGLGAGVLGVMETSWTGPTDQFWSSGFPPPGYMDCADVPFSQYSGMVAFNIEGIYIPQRGDLNCDGSRDALDVGPFVQALLDPSAYAAAFPECNIQAADMNGDGNIDGLDIAGFTKCITGGPCP